MGADTLASRRSRRGTGGLWHARTRCSSVRGRRSRSSCVVLGRLISGIMESDSRCVLALASWSIAVGDLRKVWAEFERLSAGGTVLGGVSSARRTACTYRGLAAAATAAWGAGAGRLAWKLEGDGPSGKPGKIPGLLGVCGASG